MSMPVHLMQAGSRSNLLFDHQPLRKTFFQQIGNPLLQRFIDYWAAQLQPVVIDLGVKIKGAAPDELLSKWHEWAQANPAISEEPHQHLRCINDVGRRKAEFLLIPAANRAGLPPDLILQKIAMRLYLNHPDEFWQAYNSFYASKLGAHRHFRGKNVHPLSKAEVESRIGQFMAELAPRMKKSRYEPPIDLDVIETQGQIIILLSYPYLRVGLRKFNSHSGKAEYSEDRFIKDGMILLDNSHGTMKMKMGRSPKLIEAVCRLVGEIFFDDLEWFSSEFSLDLSLLSNPNFGDNIPASSPFKSLKITSLTFTANGDNSKLSITDDDGVWPVFGDIYKFAPTDIAPQSAKLVLEPRSGGRGKVVNLNLPNRTSLDETEKDNQAESLLRHLGLILGGKRSAANQIDVHSS